MEKEELISVMEFCSNHNLEISFVHALRQYGLVETITIEKISYLPAAQLPTAEKMIRLHADLGINMEGIDAIRHLLERMENMHHEIVILRDRLKLYEENE
jgi:hypothetical protein